MLSSLWGGHSKSFVLKDMIFQSTVWGPYQWNAFFGDNVSAVVSQSFLAALYADDANSVKRYRKTISTTHIRSELAECHKSLHRWGGANFVTFDAGKKDQNIVALENAETPAR